MIQWRSSFKNLNANLCVTNFLPPRFSLKRGIWENFNCLWKVVDILKVLFLSYQSLYLNLKPDSAPCWHASMVLETGFAFVNRTLIFPNSSISIIFLFFLSSVCLFFKRCLGFLSDAGWLTNTLTCRWARENIWTGRLELWFSCLCSLEYFD